MSNPPPKPSQDALPAIRSWQESPVVDLIFKGLATVSLPLAIWGVNLHSQLAVQAEQLLRHETQIIEIRTAHREDARKMQDELGNLRVAFGRLEVKIEAANDKLTDVKTLLDRRSTARSGDGN